MATDKDNRILPDSLSRIAPYVPCKFRDVARHASYGKYVHSICRCYPSHSHFPFCLGTQAYFRSSWANCRDHPTSGGSPVNRSRWKSNLYTQKSTKPSKQCL